MNTTEQTLFIVPYNRLITAAEQKTLLESLAGFLEDWNSHGIPVYASARIEEDLFLIIQVNSGGPGGCSKDKLFRALEEIHRESGLSPGDPGRFYLKFGDEIFSLSLKELKMKALDRDFFLNARLFPSWISSAEDWEKLWNKPLHAFPSLLPAVNLV